MLEIDRALVDAQYLDWFLNTDVGYRLDRIAMMDFNSREVGVGMTEDDNYTYVDPAQPFAVLSVVNYTYRNEDAFITGVVYQDLDGDDFYTPGTGEALGNVPVHVYDSITKLEVADGQTFASGGYAFQLSDGIYDLIFDAPGGPVIYNGVELAGENVKLDHVAVPEPGAVLWLLGGLSLLLRRRRRCR